MADEETGQAPLQRIHDERRPKSAPKSANDGFARSIDAEPMAEHRRQKSDARRDLMFQHGIRRFSTQADAAQPAPPASRRMPLWMAVPLLVLMPILALAPYGTSTPKPRTMPDITARDDGFGIDSMTSSVTRHGSDDVLTVEGVVRNSSAVSAPVPQIVIAVPTADGGRLARPVTLQGPNLGAGQSRHFRSSVAVAAGSSGKVEVDFAPGRPMENPAP